MIDLELKRCARCNQDKDASGFSKDRISKDGRHLWCRECAAEYQKGRLPAEGKAKGKMAWQELNDLAIRTRNWALRMGAYEDKTTAKHGYFSVPEWCNEFERKPKDWKQVKTHLFRIGEPLAVDEWAGHYWGNQGSQGSTALMIIKRMQGLAETLAAVLEAQQHSGRWELIREMIADAMAQSDRDMTIASLPSLLSGAGIKLDQSFEQMLLAAPTPN